MKEEHLLSSAMKSQLQQTNDFMFVKDRNFIYVGCSDAFAIDCTGHMSVEEVLGRTDFEIFEDQALAQKYRSDDEELFRTGIPKIEYCESYPDKNGRKRYCRTTKLLVRNDMGEVVGMYGVCRDITEQVELEQTGVKQKKRLSQNAEIFEAMQSIYNVIFFMDLEKDTYNHIVGSVARPVTVPEKGSISVMFEKLSAYGLNLPAHKDVQQFLNLSALRTRIDREGIVTQEMNTKNMGWVRVHMIPVQKNAEGHVLSCLWVSEPIEQEMQTRDDLKNRNSILDALRKVYDVCLYWDLEKGTYFRVYGRDGKESKIVPQTGVLKDIVPLWIKSAVTSPFVKSATSFFDLSTIQERLNKQDVLTMEVETIDGWLRTSLVAVDRNEEGQVNSCLWVGEDIDDEKQELLKHTLAMEEANHVAHTDALTGLFNRGGCMNGLKSIANSGKPALFALFDVNDFKHVNDKYGHAVGDAVLVLIANAMRTVFDEEDILARFGGDEFLLCSCVSTIEEAKAKLNALVEEIEKSERSELDGERIRISMGACFTNEEHTESFEKIYELCDQLMYRCKEQIAVAYQLQCSCGKIQQGTRKYHYTLKDPLLLEKHIERDLIAAFTSMYSCVCALDLMENNCIVLKSGNSSEPVRYNQEKLEGLMTFFVRKFVDPKDQEKILQFTDIRTLKERLNHEAFLNATYIDAQTGVESMVRFLPMSKNENEDLHLVLLLVL